jgi:signal transduction histidine kinase
MDAGPLDRTGMEDVIRFNEAIDQAVAESVGHFHCQVEQARNLLLGMLAHDMRSPLGTILTTASHLAGLNAGEQVSSAAARMVRSGESIRALLEDLVDFNRTTLGVGIPVRPTEADLAVPTAQEVDQLRGAYPGRRIELAVSGDCRGCWDAKRLQQALRNLVSNAVHYGAPDRPIRVALRGEESELRLEVTNSGAHFETATLEQMFDPLKRGAVRQDPDESGSLGLGLFIVREVARAHGGDVEVRSNRGETTFAVRVPRRATRS